MSQWVTSLRSDAQLEQFSDLDWQVSVPGNRLFLQFSTPEMVERLRALAEPESAAIASSCADPKWQTLLSRLSDGGLLTRSLFFEGRLLLSVDKVSAKQPLAVEQLPEGIPLVLSRFATMRRERDRFVLDLPQRRIRLRLADPAVAAWVAGWHEPVSWEQYQGAFPSSVHQQLVSLFLACGFLLQVHDNGTEEDELVPATWEFHDLWMYSQTRQDLSLEAPVAYRFRDLDTPELAEPENRFGGALVELPAPSAPSSEGWSEVLARRTSLREPGGPLRLGQLSDFLHYSASSQERSLLGHSFLRRPFPQAGAIHALEFFLVIKEVDGLEPAIYHYQSSRHRLELVSRDEASCLELLLSAENSCGGKAQVLILLVAEMPKLAFKYQNFALSLMYRNAGAALQTFYLVATALNLAPVAIGSGVSRSFAQQVGASPFQLSIVGEFLLSTKKSESD